MPPGHTIPRQPGCRARTEGALRARSIVCTKSPPPTYPPYPPPPTPPPTPPPLPPPPYLRLASLDAGASPRTPLK